jgi:ribose-phosphate pyrophosphokinase
MTTLEQRSRLGKKFITPEIFDEIKKRKLQGPNGWILFAACNEGIELADQVKKEYESRLREADSELTEIPLLNNGEAARKYGRRIIRRFEDTETAPRLPASVKGADVFVFQYVHELVSGNVVNDNFMQLLQLVRTLKVNDAQTITVVTPYSVSSRQDKPTLFKREATMAKLAADLLETSGANRVIVYHPHAEGIRGFYEPNIRFYALSGLDLFIEIAEQKGLNNNSDVVCVSTDAGGAKLTIHYAGAIGDDFAIGNKYRPEQEKADILGIIGNVKGKKIGLLGDDESVSVTSLLNAGKDLSITYGLDELYMLISHNKIRPEHVHKLREANKKYGLKEFHVTDSVPQKGEILELPFIEIHGLPERFANVINRLHYNQSVSELTYKPKDPEA